MSNKLTNDTRFEALVDDYVIVIENGVSKKYHVRRIDKNSILGDIEILSSDHTIVGLSDRQGCFICENACIQNIPIIEFTARGMFPAQRSDFVKPYYDERHDIFINGHLIGRLDTTILSANYNRLHMIPHNHANIEIDIDSVWYYDRDFGGDSYSSVTTAFSALYFDPSFYNYRGVNVVTTVPIDANNPNLYANGPTTWFWNRYIDSSAFYTNFYAPESPYSGIISKKLITQDNGTLALSCQTWRSNDFYDTKYAFGTIWGGPYYKSDLSPGCNHQQVSTYFWDLDPCGDPNGYVKNFKFLLKYYYTDTGADTHGVYYYAYNAGCNNIPSDDPPSCKPDITIETAGAPSFRKLIFHTNLPFTEDNKIEIYDGLYPNINGTFDTRLLFTDVGFTGGGLVKYSGVLYITYSGNVAYDANVKIIGTQKYTIIDGIIRSIIDV
jgi:hypothetical protein